MVKHTFKLYDSLEQNWSWKELKSHYLIKKYKFLLPSVIISTETWSNRCSYLHFPAFYPSPPICSTKHPTVYFSIHIEINNDMYMQFSVRFPDIVNFTL